MLSCVLGSLSQAVCASVSSRCMPAAEPETLRWLDPESILSLGSRPSEAVLIMSEGAPSQKEGPGTRILELMEWSPPLGFALYM